MAELDPVATSVRVRPGIAVVVEALVNIPDAVSSLRLDLRPGDQRPS